MSKRTTKGNFLWDLFRLPYLALYIGYLYLSTFKGKLRKLIRTEMSTIRITIFAYKKQLKAIKYCGYTRTKRWSAYMHVTTYVVLSLTHTAWVVYIVYDSYTAIKRYIASKLGTKTASTKYRV